MIATFRRFFFGNPVRRVPVLSAAFLALSLTGCGTEQKPTNLPPTHEVRGTVLQADGNPLSGGHVQFTPKQPTGLTLSGSIGPEGQFSMKTIGSEGAVSGTPEGTYTATVTMPLSTDPTKQHLAGGPIAVPGEFTVKAGGENNFTLKLPAKKP
jgi:hypothetical protein